MAPKSLLVFCDGTGMDGSLAPPKSDKPNKESPQTVLDFSEHTLSFVEGGGGNTQYATNILRLARSVRPLDANGNRQIVFYQSGVGSEANFAGDPVTGTTAMQALGTAVASKIRDAYVFIAQNYEEGDDICLFGFSRGAYTARKLSGLIDDIGLLTREKLSHFFEIWRQLIDKETPTIPPDTRHPNIKLVGVFDTVGSVYKEIDALNISDTTLPATVKNAFHAVSLQENRKKFLPTLWTVPSGGLKPGQVLKQVWFPGAHSDVGGGYERHELADISVFWMAGEIQSLINLDTNFLRSWSQVRPDPWGTSQPHNAYMETPIYMRPVVGHEDRLQGGQIVTSSVFHESIKYSPQSLVSPDYMITMSIIQQSFGSGFVPQYPPLNTFEKYCKDHWGTDFGAPDHGVESPAIVIRPRVHWTSGQLGLIPPSAIVGGNESNGTKLYVARASYQGGIHPGKTDGKLVHISYDGKEIIIRDNFELLVGQQSFVRWVSVAGRFSFAALGGAVPVRGGIDTDQAVLYIARGPIERGIHPGKVRLDGHAYIPYDSRENILETYEVLVYV